MTVYNLTPEEWLALMVEDLEQRRGFDLGRMAWYLGTQDPPEVPAKYKASYKLLLDMSKNRWARLVVDGIAERITLQGVRSQTSDVELDLWEQLRRNHIDADQHMVYTEALILSTGYASVWPTDNELKPVSIRPESRLTMTHISDSEDHRVVAAALKMWKDATAKRVFATLYLPDTIYRFEAEIPKDHDQRNLTIPAHQRYQWEPRGEQPQAENPVGEVPVVPFFNRPSLALHGGTSEIDDILPILERCDKLTLDMLLASDSAAFRQKWATGLKVPRDPETKKPIEPYDAAVRKLWVSEDPNSKFGDFSATDLRPYMEVIKGAVADISAISRVPSYYLVSPDLVNPPSADTVRAAEAGLVGKATDLMDSFGESWETVLRLAMTITKNERRNELLKMVWKDPAERSMDKLADAATKWATLGVPHQVLWEQAGATPDDVVRWQTIAAQESMQKTLFAPPTTPTPPPGEPAPEPAPA